MKNTRLILGVVSILVVLAFSLMLVPAAHGEEDPLSDIVASKVEEIARGFVWVEGPVWHKDGYLLFSDTPNNQIIKWLKKDTTEVWREPSGNSIGLTFDLQGRLIACEHGNRRVSRTEKDGSITVIANRYEGKRLNSPNDCVVRSDGTIFFTDPTYTPGRGGEPSDLGFKGVYRVTPGEEPILLVKKGLYQPNGIAFSPDEKTLYVGDGLAPEVRAFKVEDDDSLSGGEVIARTSDTDGMKVDVKGRLFVTSMYGIVVYDSSGKELGVIEVPQQPTSCAFGDKDNKTLYITAGSSLYKVRVKTPGVKVWR